MERDDLIVDNQYCLDAHHDEETGKKIRKKIVFVTILLSVITIVEVIVGVLWGKNHVGADSTAWMVIKMFYIVLTLVKAGYIVMVFMHLGDERTNLKWLILGPYMGFVAYLIFIAVTEASYQDWLLKLFGWN